MSSDYDAYIAEMKVGEDAALSERRCVYSGMKLDQLYEPDAHGRNTLACLVCDCFGYNPDDARLGPK